MSSSKFSSVALAVGAAALGAALMYTWTELGAEPSRERARNAAEHETDHEHSLWTCGMHPEVVSEEPGQCPICHMDLTPMEIGAEPAPVIETDVVYSCEKHPMIEEPQAGVCPIDGLDLVPVDGDGGVASAVGSTDPSGSEIAYYQHPHDPTVVSLEPARDEMGMEFVPVYATGAKADETGGVRIDPLGVRIDPSVVQTMNVQTALVERRDVARPIRTVGTLEFDQERMVTVTTKFSGFVENVYANFVGEPVAAGQPLLDVYSPELVQTQQELLSALDFARRMADAPEESRRRAEALVDAARTRLRYWDISSEQIERLEQSGSVLRTLTLVSPADGVIMRRMAGLDGMAVRPGMELFHVADLSVLWLGVEVFEDQVAWIGQGTEAEVTFSYFQGEAFRGTVRYLEPSFDETTRTLRVRIEIPNPAGRLRVGMFATVHFRPDPATDVVAVPSQSILRTGRRNVVILDVGGGRFVPRGVVLGRQGEGWTEIVAGVTEGERVVTSAQFLLDSEASLQAAVRQMLAGRTP